MMQDRNARPSVVNAIERKINDINAGRVARVEQHLTPGINDEAVAIGRATIFMDSYLRGRDHEHRIFDRACAHEDMPVRLTGRHGERGGNGCYYGSGFG